MTETVKSRECQKCCSKATKVWVIEDPYYGYGHFAQLLCNYCKPGTNFHDSDSFTSHSYDPDYDDFHLGYSDKHFDYTSVYFGKTGTPLRLCFQCQKTVIRSGDTKLGTKYIENIGRFVTFCTNCFHKMNGDLSVYGNMTEEIAKEKWASYEKISEDYEKVNSIKFGDMEK
jgi:hypothetical protein